MTETTTLAPGRELDEAVAVAVFGWKPGNRDRGDMKWKKPDGKGALTAPYYSTDIAFAWEVVGKMCETQRFYLDGLGFDGEQWRCTVHEEHDDDHQKWHAVAAATAPHAICLAALRAMEAHP